MPILAKKRSGRDKKAAVLLAFVLSLGLPGGGLKRAASPNEYRANKKNKCRKKSVDTFKKVGRRSKSS